LVDAAQILIGRIVLRLQRGYEVRGVRIIVTAPNVKPEECIERIEAALTLIERTEARAARLFSRIVRHVLVWPGTYTAYDKLGGIHLAADDLLSASPLVLASAFVHEATHLRIERLGVPYDEEIRARIEGICVREQASFLSLVPPDGPRLARQVLEGLGEP